MWFIMIDSVRYKDLWFTKLIDAPRLALIPLQKRGAIAENKYLWLWSQSKPFVKGIHLRSTKHILQKNTLGSPLDTFRLKCYQQTVLPTIDLASTRILKSYDFWSNKTPYTWVHKFWHPFSVTFGHKIAKVGNSGAKW